MEKTFVLLAGIAGFVGVAAGASSAHSAMEPASRDLMQTASSFLMIHGAVLFGVSNRLSTGVARGFPHTLLATAAWLFIVGMVLFGGGLLVHAMAGLAQVAIVVPFGGGALMLAWLAVALYGAVTLVQRPG